MGMRKAEGIYPSINAWYNILTNKRRSWTVLTLISVLLELGIPIPKSANLFSPSPVQPSEDVLWLAFNEWTIWGTELLDLFSTHFNLTRVSMGCN